MYTWLKDIQSHSSIVDVNKINYNKSPVLFSCKKKLNVLTCMFFFSLPVKNSDFYFQEYLIQSGCFLWLRFTIQKVVRSLKSWIYTKFIFKLKISLKKKIIGVRKFKQKSSPSLLTRYVCRAVLALKFSFFCEIWQ